MTTFSKWLDTFLEEKELDLEEHFTIETEGWGTNLMPYGVVIEAIKNAPKNEQKAIQDTIVMIDFKNGDVKHYLRHLGKALAV